MGCLFVVFIDMCRPRLQIAGKAVKDYKSKKMREKPILAARLTTFNSSFASHSSFLLQFSKGYLQVFRRGIYTCIKFY